MADNVKSGFEVNQKTPALDLPEDKFLLVAVKTMYPKQTSAQHQRTLKELKTVPEAYRQSVAMAHLLKRLDKYEPMNDPETDARWKKARELAADYRKLINIDRGLNDQLLAGKRDDLRSVQTIYYALCRAEGFQPSVHDRMIS